MSLTRGHRADTPRTPAPRKERTSADTQALGELLRQAREKRGWSLKRFASSAGMSEGLLSQFERGKGNPSLLTLQKLAAALEIPLGDLFYQAAPRPATDETAAHRLTSAQCSVVTASGRKKLVFPHDDLMYELLTPDLQRQLELLRCTVPPGFDGSAMPFQHDGEESVHVLEGNFQAHVADDVYDLGPGDTITLQSSLPHWWRNIGDSPVLVLCAATPPSF
ncbi:MAG: helix-turn-helix domain-containing protein [Nocardioidaceae bacterium]